MSLPIDVPVTELDGDELDYWVAKVEKLRPIPDQPRGFFYWDDPRAGPVSGWYSPSTEWSHGGPLIEKGRAYLEWDADGYWVASVPMSRDYRGSTALIAAMRAIVAGTFGKHVTVEP